jgi:hypothetical protein
LQPEPFWRDGDGDFNLDLVKVPHNRPGHTWDIVLNTSENPHYGYGADGWSFGIGAEGPVRITDVTTLGTAGCDSILGPPCRKWTAGFEHTAITGPPDGEGPQTPDNAGAICAVILKYDGIIMLPPEGDTAVCKIRVSGDFPAAQGEQAPARVFFATRTHSTGYTPVHIDFVHGQITLEEGDPPLTVETCEFRLKAVSPVAPFIRCDANDDGRVDVSDAVWSLHALFRAGSPKGCRAAADCNGDGAWDISDGIFTLRRLFTGGPPPPAPYPNCGSAAGVLPEDCPFGSTRCPP